MNKIVSVVKLMAKTGLFFAHADGTYSDKEIRFLHHFIAGIEQIGDIDDELRQDVKDAIARQYTREEIFADTEALLSDFSNDERKAILRALNTFIIKVIGADNHIHALELQNYQEWKQTFCIE